MIWGYAGARPRARAALPGRATSSHALRERQRLGARCAAARRPPDRA